MVKTIWLLTHPTEFDKPSNTGHLLSTLFGAEENCLTVMTRVVSWQRVQPDAGLLKALEAPSVLIYPSIHAVELDVRQPCVDLDPISNFVIIDATWQLARKMFNQSGYLQQLPSFKLSGAEPSRYLLRRNQQQTGWCTAEIGVILLRLLQRLDDAQALTTAFDEFNHR